MNYEENIILLPLDSIQQVNVTTRYLQCLTKSSLQDIIVSTFWAINWETLQLSMPYRNSDQLWSLLFDALVEKFLENWLKFWTSSFSWVQNVSHTGYMMSKKTFIFLHFFYNKNMTFATRVLSWEKKLSFWTSLECFAIDVSRRGL